MKITPLAVPGRWRISTMPAMVTPAPGRCLRQRRRCAGSPRIEIGAQERDRMRVQRQLQMPVILDDLFARRHRRQCDVGLHLGHRYAREQRQVVLVAGAL